MKLSGASADGFAKFFHGFLCFKIHAKRHAVQNAQVGDLRDAARRNPAIALTSSTRSSFASTSRIGKHPQQQALSLLGDIEPRAGERRDSAESLRCSEARYDSGVRHFSCPCILRASDGFQDKRHNPAARRGPSAPCRQVCTANSGSGYARTAFSACIRIVWFRLEDKLGISELAHFRKIQTRDFSFDGNALADEEFEQRGS